ncbi:MAG: penicillin-binding protein, partial [Leptolyngbya sp. SIO1D8]|nr:penicillin-binding protein [Leptolyngbya sp. SIO1D8]
DLQDTFYKHWGKSKPWTGNRQILINAKNKSERHKKLKADGLSEEEINKNFAEPVKMKIFTWDGEVEKEMSPLDSIKHYLYFLQAGFMAMEPQSGNILAWVGGINHKYFKFDHVNINTKRQVGSTFKPIVYATALENGVEPCDFVPARRIVYKNFEDWSPGNANDNYDGSYSVKGALTHSVNTVSVKVLKRATIDKTVALAREMGIESEIPKVPSIALGTPNISLFEMVGAFATFANSGRVSTPSFLLGITDKEGNVLESFQRSGRGKRIMSTQSADMMVEMMRSVVNKGTASRLRTKYQLKNDIAGKTGTTQSHADGWFIGFTPELVAGVWVGSDDPNIHFRSISLGQGASMALPIWAIFLKQLNEDKGLNHYTKAKFYQSSGDISYQMNCEDYRDRKSFIDDIFAKILKKRNRPKTRRSKKKRPRKRRWND